MDLVQVDVELIASQAQSVVDEVAQAAGLREGKVLVIGCSTSEVLGERIGRAGSEAVAAVLVDALRAAGERRGFALAFQCCEHLNRALVVEEATRAALGLDQVTAVPVPRAGGALAATAYRALKDPVLVEHLRAQAGIDIGSTLIGMHLQPVAIPFRPAQRLIGAACVTAATTRPKLIGGARTVYERP